MTMAGVMDYHCPNCGGALQFDAELQKLKCPYCESLFSTADFIEKDGNLNQQPAESGPQAGGGAAGQSAVGADGQSGAGAGDQSGAGGVGYGGQAGHAAAPNQTQAQHGTQDVGGHTLTFDGETAWGDGEDEHLRVYSCPNCRAQVIADETTAATHCPYCGNVVVMEGQLSGDLKPDYVIPFKVTKEKAVAAFKRYINRSKFVPKVFSAQDHPEEIKGVYVPFWLFNADADVNATFHAENIRIWTDRKYEYTETSFYELVRGGTIAMRHVPVDGSKKMADELILIPDKENSTFDKVSTFYSQVSFSLILDILYSILDTLNKK